MILLLVLIFGAFYAHATHDFHAMHLVHISEERDLPLVYGVAKVVAIQLLGIHLPNHLLQGGLYILLPLLLPV